MPTTTEVSPELYNAYRATGQLISPDGRTIQFSVEFASGDMSSPEALESVPAMRADVDRRGPGGRSVGERRLRADRLCL